MDEMLDFAKDLADRAGVIMLQHFRLGVVNDLKQQEGDTPVTIADTAINTMVIEAVREHYPDHAVIGEEESHERVDAEYTWVCDPIDGTIPYVMGVPTNVFSVAVVDKTGQPIVAVVFDPYMKRKFWATKGGGAFMNGDPIHVNGMSDMSQAYIGVSGSRAKTVRAAEFKGAVVERAWRPVMMHSAIYEAMLVASGQIAATMYLGISAHDVASSKLIVEEAGGKVTDMYGNDQRYDSTVKGALASNGGIHDAILNLADQYRM